MLENKRIAVLLAEGYEDLEFWVTVMRLREEGARVTILGTKAGETVHGKVALPARSDEAVGKVKPEDFDAIVVPGGWAPDKLRRYQEVKDLVRGIYEQGKIVGLICHAGLVGISAGIVQGHKATGSLGIKDDLVNAGAIWHDEEVVVDGNLITSRKPDDLPAFMREYIRLAGKY